LDYDGQRVTGVRTEWKSQTDLVGGRRGVVLATGDYASAPDLIRRYKGPRFAEIEGIDKSATGDGHRMALDVGAKLVNMDVTYGPEIRFVPPPRKNITQILPSRGPIARVVGRLTPWVPKFVMHAMIKRLLVTWQHPENSLFDDGAILVNARGERFCNERVGPDREAAIARQPGKIAYILLDEQRIERYSCWPHFISTAPKIAYAYAEDYLRMRPDVAIVGHSLEAMASTRQMSADALRQSVEARNKAVDGRQTDEFGRAGDACRLQGRRWLLLGPAKAYFTTTEGGTAVNKDLQVLDDRGEPIAGLYAVGQIGLGGQVLWGHGLHIAWAITSGRIAGAVAARRSDGSQLV
jgi:fumarate reductase flavoprotein subunit